MTNSKLTKRALLTSVMALVLCFAMLTGTTFAWFTDTETSGNNKIVAGNLDIELLMWDGDSYEDIGSNNLPIFGVDENNLVAQNDNLKTVWEPGKTQIAYLAIRNAGNLALKYNVIVDVTDKGLVGALEYAIVPMADAITAETEKSNAENWYWETITATEGVASDFLKAGKTIAAPDGRLDEIVNGEKDETDFFALVIHMDENADNDYMSDENGEKSVVIDITVTATQVEAELDAFGPNYDAGLEIIYTADSLIEKLENGEDVILGSDIKIAPANMSNAYGTTGINVKNGQTIDGNGYTLDVNGAGGTWDSGINTTGGLIKNLTVTGSFRGIFINHNSTYSEQVVLENVIIDGTVYTISCDQGMNQTLKATGCTFNGWTSYAATLGSAEFNKCTFGEGSGYAYCRPYAPTTFTNCVFEAGYEMDPRAAVTFENCYIGDILITADNISTLVTSNVANASVK